MCSEEVGVTIIMNRTKYECNVIYSTLHYRAIQFLYRVDEYHASKYACGHGVFYIASPCVDEAGPRLGLECRAGQDSPV